MKYKVIEGFYDLQDKDEKGNCHLYNRGDIYPREGAQPTEERIAELSGKDNKRRQALIEEIPEDTEGAVPEETVEAVSEDADAGEAPRKRRSKKAQ